jgi:hypothetical protein
VDPLPGWAPDEPVVVAAYGQGGHLIEHMPAVSTAEGIFFTYRQRVAGQSVAYYRLSRPQRVFLPVLLRGRR